MQQDLRAQLGNGGRWRGSEPRWQDGNSASEGPRERAQADSMETLRSEQPPLDACNGTG